MWKASRPRLADPVQVEALTPQQLRRVCTADPAGLAWPLHPYIPYYNRAAVLGCTASGRDAGIWYVLEVLRRCDTLQRGTGGIIAACVGMVSRAVERAQSSGKPL